MTQDELNQKLFDAAQCGDLPSVKSFISQGADSHAEGDRALRLAAESTNDALQRVAVGNEYSHSKLVGLLLYAADAPAAKATPPRAAHQDRMGVVRFLLQRPGHTLDTLRPALTRMRADGAEEGPGTAAIETRIHELMTSTMAKRVVESGLSPAVRSRRSQRPRRPRRIQPVNQDDLNEQLIIAARRGDAGKVQSLLDRGADVHAQDDKALRSAAINGHTETVALLLDRGADVHAEDDGALRLAAKNGRTEVVGLLLEHEADVHAEDDWALRWAADNGHTEVVALLLDRGADVHVRDDSALRWAAERGHTEMVALLLDRGADVHAEDDWALRLAAGNGHTETVALLLAQSTYTPPRLRAAMARCQAGGCDETTDAFRMIPARIDVLTAEDVAERVGSSGLSETPIQSDGGLGM